MRHAARAAQHRASGRWPVEVEPDPAAGASEATAGSAPDAGLPVCIQPSKVPQVGSQAQQLPLLLLYLHSRAAALSKAAPE